MRKIIFIGPVGATEKMASGDSIKNYFVINRIKEHAGKLLVIDTNIYRKSLLKIIQMLFILVLNRKARYVVSASSGGAYKMLRLMRMLGIHDIIYWVVGGDAPHLICSEVLDIDVYRNVRKIIVEGKSMQETMRITGFKDVTVLPNFKKITYIPPKSFQRQNGRCRFVFLSRVTEDKGCGYITEAVRLLNERGLENAFCVDFYGSLLDDYKDTFLSGLADLPNAEYKGFLKLLDPGNYNHLASYDAMLFPTFFYGEGFAGIFIDAMIAGLPVIATEWNVNRDVVEEGQTGLFVPPRRAKPLADAMQYLIEHPEKVEEMGKIAQSRCMDYSADHVVTDAFLEGLGL